jgi:hypothetical protein
MAGVHEDHLLRARMGLTGAVVPPAEGGLVEQERVVRVDGSASCTATVTAASRS